MKIKEMIELRNVAVAALEALVTTVETETRSLTEAEVSQAGVLETEIRSYDAKISAASLIGSPETRAIDESLETELRELGNFVKGVETRATNKTADGAAVIPTQVAGLIVKKMEETSSIFARATKFPSSTGTLKIAVENAQSNAGFVGEDVDVAALALSLGEVKLTQKRCGAAITLSNQLINDTAVDVITYATNLLARRTAKAIEKSALLGVAADDFKGLFPGTTQIVNTAVSGVVSIDDLMGLYNSVNPEFLSTSSWTMSRPFFNTASKMKDAMGHYYMSNGVVNGRPQYTLFGASVEISDAITSIDEPVLFGSIQEAYAIMVKQGFTLTHVTGDTTQALRGTQLLVLDGYMDGVVYNTQAISKLDVTR